MNEVVKRISCPLPLTFKNEKVSIYLKDKKIVSVKLEDKFYRESRITIQNQEFVSPPVSFHIKNKKRILSRTGSHKNL